MSSHVLATSSALVVLGLSCLALSPGCSRPLEIQKGDYLLHGTADSAPHTESVPTSQPKASPDPDYHPE
jgi:hypothetical protein